MRFNKFLYEQQADVNLCSAVLHTCHTEEQRFTSSFFWDTTDRPWWLLQVAQLTAQATGHQELHYHARLAAWHLIKDFLQPKNKEVCIMLQVYHLHLHGEHELSTGLALSFQRLVCTLDLHLEPVERMAAHCTVWLLMDDLERVARDVAKACQWYRPAALWFSVWPNMAQAIREKVPGHLVCSLIETYKP